MESFANRSPRPDPRALRTSESLARARLLAAGALCSGIVHEFANFLTIVDCMRQMNGLELADARTGHVIAGPADRCGSLLEAFRAVFAEPADFGDLSVETELKWIERLLQARMRGRGTRVAVAALGEPLALPGECGAPVRLGLLCALLGYLEHAPGAPDPSTIVLSAEGSEQRCRALRVRLAGIGGGEGRADLAESFAAAARETLAEVAARLDVEKRGPDLEIHLALGA